LDHRIAWYENDGAANPSFAERAISTSAEYARSVYAADVDGDGDMDVLSASTGDDKIAWYENDQFDGDDRVATGLTSSVYDPAEDLVVDTTYQWRVVAYNAAGITSGPTWTFTTQPPLPGTPSVPAPADGASGIAIATSLDWADCSDAATYDLYLWESLESKPGSPTSMGLTQSNYDPPADLSDNTAHTWQVVARNVTGDTSGPTWTFTTELLPPDMPSTPSPVNGAADALISTNLDWADSANALTYDVYVWETSGSKPGVPTAAGLPT
ncbi:unnamed protein product, partial [marine sediment metagenome]